MPRTTWNHPRGLTALVLSLALVAGACGGGGDGEEAAATATPAAAAEPTATPEPEPSTTAEPTPAATTAPTPEPAPTASPTPTDTSPSDPETWSWSRPAGEEAGFGDSTVFFSSVAFGADVFVAGGSVQTAGGGFVAGELWTSSDGLSWTQAALPDDAAALEVQEVGFIAGQFVAVGLDTGGGALWLSSDGTEWESRTPDAWNPSFSPRAVTVGSTGLVVTGVSGRQRVEMWHSGDALAWTEAGIFEDPQGVWVDAIAHGADGFVAVGRQGEGNERRAAIFVSADGLSWSQIPGDDSLFPSASSLNAVTASGELGYVAVGVDQSSPDFASLWSSVDGSDWDRSPTGRSEGQTGVQDMTVTADGSTILAVGFTGPQAKVWSADSGSDGSGSLEALREVDLPEPEQSWATAIAVGEDRVVVVGASQSDTTWKPTAWVATPTR